MARPNLSNILALAMAVGVTMTATLDPIQRQAFFKNWSEPPFSRRAEAPHASAKPS